MLGECHTVPGRRPCPLWDFMTERTGPRCRARPDARTPAAKCQKNRSQTGAPKRRHTRGLGAPGPDGYDRHSGSNGAQDDCFGGCKSARLRAPIAMAGFAAGYVRRTRAPMRECPYGAFGPDVSVTLQIVCVRSEVLFHKPPQERRTVRAGLRSLQRVIVRPPVPIRYVHHRVARSIQHVVHHKP